MTSRRERSEKKYGKIRKAFAAYDLKKLRLEHVMQELADKFDLAPDTIYSIVRKTGRYKNT